MNYSEDIQENISYLDVQFKWTYKSLMTRWNGKFRRNHEINEFSKQIPKLDHDMCY